MLRRDISRLPRQEEVFSLFIYQIVGRTYVITLNDRFNISCQMSIESVIQLLPVVSMLTFVIQCLFMEIIIIAGILGLQERNQCSLSLTLLVLCPELVISIGLKLYISFLNPNFLIFLNLKEHILLYSNKQMHD